ncbi:MAG: PRD domain-containing protein [Anaerolineaceae bacterium]|nr:PRD domain-containing protein [Anaerolineaceae bacterium]
MRAVRKINNNVALCVDKNGHQLVAFGKGIGFHEMPYEITDLQQIERTFYNISSNYVEAIADIPENVFVFTGRIIDSIRNEVPYELTPNYLFTLADHIAFCLERHQRDIYVQMPLQYEIAQTYPLELKLGETILNEIEKKFNVELNPREASGIALSIVNARMDKKTSSEKVELDQHQFDEVLEDITAIIEEELDHKIDRYTFGYARFSSHLQHLYGRLCKGISLETENLSVYGMIREQYTKVNHCVEKISDYFGKKLKCTLADEEKMYLILHLNRIYSKEEK